MRNLRQPAGTSRRLESFRASGPAFSFREDLPQLRLFLGHVRGVPRRLALPRGLRLAPPRRDEDGGPGEGGGRAGHRAAGSKAKRRKGTACAATRPCRLAIVNRGKAEDEKIAAVRLDADVDAVMRLLLEKLGAPEPPPYSLERDPLRLAAEQPGAGEPAGGGWRIGSNG